jgi:serine/threonine-protein kinase RsbW
VSSHEGEAVVEVIIPAKAEFVGVARLAILGVSSRMRFSYDEVEDIRLAVGEAVTTAIEWGEARGATSSIRIRCLVRLDKLIIDVFYPLVPDDAQPSIEPPPEERNLGGILIRILMDDVLFPEEEQRRFIRMVKVVENGER